jgi:pimeloyl-ACP methyl ester carboxylesterase
MRSTILLIILSTISFFCNKNAGSPNISNGYAEVNGTKLYYEMAGQGEPLVFVHGNFGDRRHWDFQFLPLAKEFKVIRYDVRGYGKSALPKQDESYRDCDDLKALLDYLKIEKAHICGVSMGSGIAVDFALAYPERCLSLIPIGPAPNGFAMSEYTTPAIDSINTIIGKVFELITTQGPRQATDYWWTGDHEIRGTVTSQRTLDSLLTMGYRYSWWGFLHENKRAWVEPPAIMRLEEIKMPVLIITADHDIQACREIAGKMHERIAGSKLVSMEGAGHVMNMDQPEVFNKILTGFINELKKSN